MFTANRRKIRAVVMIVLDQEVVEAGGRPRRGGGGRPGSGRAPRRSHGHGDA